MSEGEAVLAIGTVILALGLGTIVLLAVDHVIEFAALCLVLGVVIFLMGIGMVIAEGIGA